MALTVRHPFADLSPFDHSLARFFAPTEATADSRRLLPAVDIEADEKEYRIVADLPGVAKKDIDVQLDGNQLTISARRETSEQSEERGYVRRERSSGEYLRSFTLPDVADAEALTAKYKEGVLHVTIPKTQDPEPRQIKIQ